MHLAGAAAAVGAAAGDLPQGEHLPGAAPAADGKLGGGLGQVVAVLAAVLVEVPGGGERGGGQVGDAALAVGEQVEPGVQDVGEQLR